MSLNDERLSQLTDERLRQELFKAHRDIATLRASHAKVVEALWNLLDASDDSDSAYREELLDAARSRARAILIDGEKEGK